MNIAQRGPAERGGAAVNVADADSGIIDLTSDSDTSSGDDLVELAAKPVQLRPVQNRSHLAPPPPPPQPQNWPAMSAAANAGPSPALFNPPPSPRREEDPGFGRAFWGDYVIDEEFDDEMIARAMEREFQQEARQPDEPPAFLRPENRNLVEPLGVETRLQCVDNVMILFPEICRDHVSELYDTVSKSSDRLIAHILDRTEKGMPYPKAKDKQRLLKRKREEDEDEEAARKYGALDRVIPSAGGNSGIRGYIRKILNQEFPETPMVFIDATLAQSGHRLFSAYRVLEEAHRTFDPRRPPYNKIKKQRQVLNTYNEENIEAFMAAIDADKARVEVLRELLAARRIRKKADQKRLEEYQAELEEEANSRKAQAEGTMSECGCCYGDYPLNRMVHCDNDEMHWFCRGCALRNAETEIGNSKYELKCMSMDGCAAGFSMEQRSQFLDENTIVALERNEQEAVLRMAGIENLASCPFCPFAAEYPPVEENREFRCQAPDCEKVSCRLCKLESHIPKSCEEHAKENGLSIRRQIEEAMSAAMIRKCNKCGTPFVKEEGCNKMTCTRNGCYNVQCYVCSKSCAYDHFDDRSRGGKTGNCPLFESVEQRHDQEVKEAERIALEKVRADHPEYTEEDLKVKMSENVLKDDLQRKANDPRLRLGALRAGQGVAGDGFQNYFDMDRFPRPFIRRAPPPPPPQLGRVPAHVGRAYGENYLEMDGALADVFNDDIFNNLWDDIPYPPPDIAAAPPNAPLRVGDNPWEFAEALFGRGLPAIPQPAAPPPNLPLEHAVPELRNLRNLLVRQERAAAFGMAAQPAGVEPGIPLVAPPPRRRDIAELERMVVQQRQLRQDPAAEIGRFHHYHRNLEQRLAHVAEGRAQATPQVSAAVQSANLSQPSPAKEYRPQFGPGAFQADLQRELDAIDPRSQANAERDVRAIPQAAIQQRSASILDLGPENAAAGSINQMQERLRQLEGNDMRMARQQHILDHAERRLQRRQEVARLRREQEHDEAAVARELGGLRQLAGEVAGVAEAVDAHHRARMRLAASGRFEPVRRGGNEGLNKNWD